MGRAFKRCGCRDEQGRQLGTGCTKRRQKNHGAWTYVVDIQGSDGRRKQHKRGGFRTKAEAVAACESVVATMRQGAVVDDKLTVSQWLDHWLAEKTSMSGVSASGRTIRPSTEAIYSQHIRDYLKPALGHCVLAKLTADDISSAYRGIMSEPAARPTQSMPSQGDTGQFPA